ncbi:hypothetical protein M0R45_001187 [Rubus argutus]|uniref:Uncharacterized protein n=1 Tax=Rubus argutus TaxID=59490 RepID=A0AAW1VN04_RUBAR
MVLVVASTYWSHVTLWSSLYAAHAKLLAHMIRLRAHYPDHPTNSIRLDTAREFTSKFLDDYFFPSLGGDKNVYVQQERRELSWPVPTLSHNDPPTAHRSNIPAANIPARMEVPEKDFRLKDVTNATQEDGQGTADAITKNGGDVAKAMAPLRKRRRPQGSRDTRPRKRACEGTRPSHY